MIYSVAYKVHNVEDSVCAHKFVRSDRPMDLSTLYLSCS